jgi:hypothetical protein
MGTPAITRPVKMKDVSSLIFQMQSQRFIALPVRYRKIPDIFLRQQGDLTGTDTNPLFSQMLLYLCLT